MLVLRACPEVGIQSSALKGMLFTRFLFGKSRHEFASIECEDTGGTVTTFFQQFSKLIGCTFNLTKCLRIFPGISYYNNYRMIFGPELIMSIGEAANDLVTVELASVFAPGIWARKQRYMKTLSIGAVDEGSLLRDSNECLSAVRAMKGVLVQCCTPVAWMIPTVSERGSEGENEKSNVRTLPRKTHEDCAG